MKRAHVGEREHLRQQSWASEAALSSPGTYCAPVPKVTANPTSPHAPTTLTDRAGGGGGTRRRLLRGARTNVAAAIAAQTKRREGRITRIFCTTKTSAPTGRGPPLPPRPPFGRRSSGVQNALAIPTSPNGSRIKGILLYLTTGPCMYPGILWNSY